MFRKNPVPRNVQQLLEDEAISQPDNWITLTCDHPALEYWETDMVNGVKSPYADEFEVWQFKQKRGCLQENLNTKMLHISYVQRKMMHQKGKSIHRKKLQKKVLKIQFVIKD
jgi:hypothetical protein